MSRRVKLDILLDVPKADVERLGKAGAARFVMEKLRHSADAEAAKVGGQVVTTVRPELQIQVGQNPLLHHGQDMLLVAGRFAVDVPDGARLS